MYAYNYADLNNDGKLDIVAAISNISGTNRLVTFYGDGEGKFQAGSLTPVHSNQSPGGYRINFFDINNDGALDLVTFNTALMEVYFGNNTGSFVYHGSSNILNQFPFGATLVDMFDVNGDGRKDMLVNQTLPKSGNSFLKYHLSTEGFGFQSSGTAIINGARSISVEDFNNDGRKDFAATFLISPGPNHFLRFYYNQGNETFTQSQNIAIGAVEKLRLVSDFDGDGWKDFVATSVYNLPNQFVSVLYNNANQGFSVANYPITINTSSPLFYLNDFDGDGRKDFAVFNEEHSYNIYLRKRVGGFQRSHHILQTYPSLIADFNNDRKADILRIGTNSIFQTHAFQLYEADCFRRGRPDTIDYIGNGRVNFASWQPETGRWTYNDGGFQPVDRTVFWGAPGDIPTPGDYDGDGITDTAVFRPSNGTWYVNAPKAGNITFQLGASGDKPVPADFDGDFKTDFAVFRPAAGQWIVRLSASQLILTTTFGTSGDKPVPADFDGDYKADLALFRPSNGTWYYLRSSDGAPFNFQFGQAGDLPQPTDVDGDGRADFNVFRPDNLVFYFASSFDGRNSFVSRGQGGTPQPTSGFFMNAFYTYRASDGNWFGDGTSAISQTPPNEIPVTYVLPVGN
ncbi:MAG TPA: VCBS repeat-containing protein [Pyrinomonadaceae bacterium]